MIRGSFDRRWHRSIRAYRVERFLAPPRYLGTLTASIAETKNPCLTFFCSSKYVARSASTYDTPGTTLCDRFANRSRPVTLRRRDPVSRPRAQRRWQCAARRNEFSRAEGAVTRGGSSSAGDFSFSASAAAMNISSVTQARTDGQHTKSHRREHIAVIALGDRVRLTFVRDRVEGTSRSNHGLAGGPGK